MCGSEPKSGSWSSFTYMDMMESLADLFYFVLKNGVLPPRREEKRCRSLDQRTSFLTENPGLILLLFRIQAGRRSGRRQRGDDSQVLHLHQLAGCDRQKGEVPPRGLSGRKETNVTACDETDADVRSNSLFCFFSLCAAGSAL